MINFVGSWYQKNVSKQIIKTLYYLISTLAYDVERNADLFHKDVPDGVNALVIGELGLENTGKQPLAIGKCFERSSILIRKGFFLK